MLPRDDVNQLGLPIVGSRTLILGNEQRYRFDYCFTAIFWDDDIRGIPVLVSESECLVGVRLLAGNYLTAAMVPGGLVTINTLPPS